MDCRKSLRLALLLVTCTAGCTLTSPFSSSEPKDKLASADEKGGQFRLIWNEQTKLQPGTLVAHGEMMETNADERPESRERHLQLARSDYRRAIELDPHCLRAYVNLAHLQERTDEHALAVETYQQALKVAPKESAIWHELGLIQAHHKEWDASLEALQRATQLDPENKTYAKALGLTLAAAGRYEESYTCLKPIEGEAEARYIIARMLHYHHQDDAAREHIQMALQVNGDLKKAQDLLSELNGIGPASRLPREPSE
jgi:tetratricopeptide (TPR) repeat protein